MAKVAQVRPKQRNTWSKAQQGLHDSGFKDKVIMTFVGYRWLDPYAVVKNLSKGFFSLRNVETGKMIQRVHGHYSPLANLQQHLAIRLLQTCWRAKKEQIWPKDPRSGTRNLLPSNFRHHWASWSNRLQLSEEVGTANFREVTETIQHHPKPLTLQVLLNSPL